MISPSTRSIWGRPLLLALICAPALGAEIRVQDDAGDSVVLDTHAQRIVALAPHITELMFEIGAGDRLVGAVEYSDFPPGAKAIPRIGAHNAIDLETVLGLRPELIIGWSSGNRANDIQRLRDLGLSLFMVESERLQAIPGLMIKLGRLTGREAGAQRVATAFQAKLAELRAPSLSAKQVRLFYQLWNQPLMTVNGSHIISDVMRLCGGQNIFASSPMLVPTLNVEAVLAAEPQAIVASGKDDQPPPWLAEWRRWPHMRAVRDDNLFAIPPDLLQRPTSRLLLGAQRMCDIVQQVRDKG